MPISINQYVEAIDDEFPGEGVFESDHGSISRVLYIPWGDLESVLPQIIGYSTRGGAGSLNRVLPVADPLFPWMYATKITSFKPFQFNGQDSPSSPDDQPIGSYCLPGAAIYTYAKVVVQFEALTYQVLSDGQTAGDEFNRYVIKSCNPRGEAITMDKGSYVYTMGPGSIAGGATTNKPCIAALSRILNKMDIIWNWQQIPEIGAFSPGNTPQQIGIPTNQLALLGSVNGAAFEGYPAGTLLLTSIKYTPHNYAIEPDFQAIQSSRYYDVEFHVVYFSPTPTWNGSPGTWNMIPFQDGNWTPIGTASGLNPQYPLLSWTNLFVIN